MKLWRPTRIANNHINNFFNFFTVRWLGGACCPILDGLEKKYRCSRSYPEERPVSDLPNISLKQEFWFYVFELSRFGKSDSAPEQIRVVVLMNSNQTRALIPSIADHYLRRFGTSLRNCLVSRASTLFCFFLQMEWCYGIKISPISPIWMGFDPWQLVGVSILILRPHA